MNESKLLSPNGIVKASALCLLMSAFSVNTAFALPVPDSGVMVVQQGRTLTGTVVDNFGDPVIGANVIVKGTTIGNITDVNGTFTVENVPDNAVLQISYIGFKTLEVSVKGQTTFNITLQEDTENLQEVVVVGYGSSVKKDLTTAVTSVSSKDFLAGAVNDPMQMVDGKVAGVVVNSVAAADPNTSGSIQVRGASSLKAGNSPLIVIDGMPGGDLRNLAQSDIESITVLKDGSAAAIYGSRGANGVILVTTKQGKAGKTTITYDGYVEHDFVASKPDVLDADAYLDKVTGAVDYGHRTNWYDELINKNNFGHNHNISLSGGSETTIFRMSANFKGKEGLDIASDRKEYGLRGNFKHTTLEGLLEVGVFNDKKYELKDVANQRRASLSVFVFIIATVFIVLFGSFDTMRPSFMVNGEQVLLDMPSIIEILMLSAAAIILLVTRTDGLKAAQGSVFGAGMQAVVAIFGIAWMGDTFLQGNMAELKSSIEEVVRQMPWLFGIALFVMSILLYSQAATVRALMPLGIALGISPYMLIAMFPAVNGYFFIPNYPTQYSESRISCRRCRAVLPIP